MPRTKEENKKSLCDPWSRVAATLLSSRSLAGLATRMLASLAFAYLVSLRARTVTLLSSMMAASVLLMAMWLNLDGDIVIISRIRNSADQNLITIWPFTLELLLLVVLGEGILGDLFIQESLVCSFVCGLAGWVCAFDFGVLLAADTIIVVVDICLEDCEIISSYSENSD